MKGKLIVLEGTDGSGKSTQFRLLCDWLTDQGKPFTKIVFPQYEKPSSALIRMYLGGEFGKNPGDVNAYAASTFYAVDRFASYRQAWGKVYEAGGLILADRYTTSNAVHQTGKEPREKWGEFLTWLEDLEYGKLGLPRPDLVLYLDMPTDLAVTMLRRREGATHTAADIHEVDTAYLAHCRQVAQAAAAHYGWQKVSCADGRGQIRPMEDIQGEIRRLVRAALGE